MILEGRIKVTILGDDGREVILSVLGPGDFFGEMALLDRQPRSATVTAETDMHLLVLSSREFSSLVDDVPIVARRIMRGLAERLRNAEPPQPQH
jgi:CRP-like cAMP-binding protein